MKTSDYLKAGGEIIESGFRLIIGLAVAFVIALIVIVALLVKIFVFPSDKADRSAEDVPAMTAPVVQIQYPKVQGLCFRTPMGDVGKVIGQRNDMLEMTFRGGVKSTYQFDQVSHTDCSVLPAN